MVQIASLVPRLPDLFNIAREMRGSLVKLITCVTSGGTNFHIWHNSKLAKIKATDGESSSSSISMLQSAMNQQAETFQSLWYESKTEICMIIKLDRVHAQVEPTWMWARSSYHANCSFRHAAKELKGLRLLIYSRSDRKTRAFGEKLRLSSRPTRCFFLPSMEVGST